MTPKLSIIVPVYNVEPYLQRCIDSLLNQTFQDWEMILVDDGSTDRSGTICYEAATKDNRIKIIHQKNAGLSAARNSGLDIAQGEYITFIDSDDIIYWSTSYENAVKLLDENQDVDIVQFPYNRFTATQPEPLTYKVNWAKLHTKDEFIDNLDTCGARWQDSIFSGAPAKLYRRQIFEGVRYPMGVVWEDIHVLLQLFDKIKGIMITDCGFYGYYYREDSIAHSDPKPRPMIDKLDSLIAVSKYQIANSSNPEAREFTFLWILNFIQQIQQKLGKDWKIDPQLEYFQQNIPPVRMKFTKKNLKVLIINCIGVKNYLKLVRLKKPVH